MAVLLHCVGAAVSEIHATVDIDRTDDTTAATTCTADNGRNKEAGSEIASGFFVWKKISQRCPFFSQYVV